MKKLILSGIVFFIWGIQFSFAQVSIGVGVGRGYGYGNYGGYYNRPMNRYNRYPVRARRDSMLPKFEPRISFSLGAGFPNLDANQMASFFNYYKGSVSQSAPIIGSIDYQYSRTASIGIMVSHAQVNAPYYDYSGNQAFTGSLDNWAIMLNMINYLPTSTFIQPYFRTAVGVNIWNQNYIDITGNKMGYVSEPSMFAYQIALGANFKLTKNLGFFTEVGYGKYILHGGLKFQIQ